MRREGSCAAHGAVPNNQLNGQVPVLQRVVRVRADASSAIDAQAAIHPQRAHVAEQEEETYHFGNWASYGNPRCAFVHGSVQYQHFRNKHN